MEKIKPLMKKWWFWSICIVVVVGFVGVVSGGNKNNSNLVTNKPTATASVTEKKDFNWATSEVTYETIDQVLNEKKLKVTKPIKVYIVDGDDGTKEVRLTVDISAHSGDLAMRGMFKYLNEYSAFIFENPNVSKVMVRGQINLIDDKGNESTNEATYVMWTRETAATINHEKYNKIAMGSLYPSCFETADKYFIHYTIFQNMKEAGDIPSNK